MKDIDRLKDVMEYLNSTAFPHNYHGDYAQAISKAIARLEKFGPYEPGQEIEVSNTGDGWITGKFIGCIDDYVVIEDDSGWLLKYCDHRPIQEYINVKLPVDVVSRVTQRNEDKSSDSKSLLNTLCKAIAEGVKDENNQ